MTAIAELPHRALVRLTGPDWASFLKGLCTAHIDRIAAAALSGEDRLYYGAFLRPQGKMYADCIIKAVAPEEVWLDVPLSARDELLAKLNMYRLRARVTIEPLERAVFVAFGDTLPAGFSPDARGDIIAAGFGFAYGEHHATTDAAAWAEFRMARSLSDPGHDFGKDELYAIDANLDVLDAIDFHKGCYVGQELTSRMKRRGQIKNRILGYVASLPHPAGAEVLKGELRAGETLGQAGAFGLGLMRLDRMDGDLQTSSGTLKLNIAPWLAEIVHTK
ncbi:MULTISPECIES: folate-binding protein YgfZ [Asticcacaulis]|uniref:CAF17-like 4Fe-4S cluster assembly/insertion protein YgfZ n=1 Tax=Asticcacaulis TaxID=76890 RepID=UPI001AE5B471|nr:MULTISPECIES: folate-binding protein YgfZ [Asticcacaulis]MBP2158664.1 folate-binding protein YgfZ [Asticcacaulis solisilvae]MDR6799710.1 folate-binding protein YgfZ [Asticcacaulis sp. BE141]